jgi:putative endonuclease
VAQSTTASRTKIAHEKRLKRWRRDWKFALIERGNPEWRDLYDQIL